MNPNTDLPLLPNLEGLRKAVQEFHPNQRRVPFHNLKPLHDSIVELRGKTASYSLIAELLQQHGVKTSRARVAEYGRIMLDGGKRRKRRKYARHTQAIALPASTPVTLAGAAKIMPAVVSTNVSSLSPPQRSNSSYISGGPRIAKVELMTPEDHEKFEEYLKQKQNP